MQITIDTKNMSLEELRGLVMLLNHLIESRHGGEMRAVNMFDSPSPAVGENMLGTLFSDAPSAASIVEKPAPKDDFKLIEY